uniref:dATP/dGTP diphosphohydrolase N-terminal domain-containing protein n=2 Tax=unclassified bacterial viruses TaxID=12333 RepID=A0AAU6VZE6_9VIRU
MSQYKVRNSNTGSVYTIIEHNDSEYCNVIWEEDCTRGVEAGQTEYLTAAVDDYVERGIWVLLPEPRVSGEVGNPKVGAASKKYSLRYMPLSANIEANRALENGAEKYGLCNWRDTNVKASVYIDAALRHIAQWQEGQENASDSDVHNLGHAMASLAIIIDAQAQGVLIDDRPTASKDTDDLLLRKG